MVKILQAYISKQMFLCGYLLIAIFLIFHKSQSNDPKASKMFQILNAVVGWSVIFVQFSLTHLTEHLFKVQGVALMARMQT